MTILGPNNAIPIIILPGESDHDNNFMDGRPGNISGSVKDDLDNPISNVKIWLYIDVNSDGIPDGPPIDSQYTDADQGTFSFEDKLALSYVLVEEQPIDYGELSDYDTSTPPGIDDDGDDSALGPNNMIPVTISPNEGDQNNEFRDILCPNPPSIEGNETYTICDGEILTFQAQDQGVGAVDYTWYFGEGATPSSATGEGPHDVQFNWTDGNDTAGAHVMLHVFKAGCGSDSSEVATVTINPFPDATIASSLENSCWYEVLTFEPEADEIDGATYTWDFGPGAMPASATGYGPHDVLYTSAGAKSVKLTIDPNYSAQSCPDSSTFNFNLTACRGTITGSVLDEFGEPLPGVTLLLYADVNADGIPDDYGSPLSFQTTTVEGEYIFSLVNPGNYVVQEYENPAGYESLQDIDESADLDTVSNVDPLDDLIPVTVQPLVFDTENNFYDRLESGSISGTVFEDFNGDLTHDPEEGIEGVLIRLFEDSEPDGVPDGTVAIDSAYTNAQGHYIMTDIDPGNYVLQEVQPDDYVSVMDIDQSGDFDEVSNVNPTDDLIPVTVEPGDDDEDNDFIEQSECQLVVTITDNDGIGSLRAAIACAQAGDTITFDAALAGDTIVLTEALLIPQEVTILSTQDPVIHILCDMPGGITIGGAAIVEINNLNVISGNTNQPAAILNNGDLTLDDVEIIRNTALPQGSVLIENTGTITIRGTTQIRE